MFTIGAVAAAKTIKSDGKNAWYEYPTDIEGLKSLGLKAFEAADTISETITTLGMMLAYTDRLEVGDKHLCNYAWLIAGLGELLVKLSFEGQEMTHSLNVLKSNGFR